MVERCLAARIGFLWLAAILVTLATCSKSNNPVEPPASDGTPPAAVTDLAVVDPTMSSVALTWTAPGDDGTTGTAAQYDVRYSTSPITNANWAAATQVSGEPKPKSTGGKERFLVTYLSAGVCYYFALKTADERPNWSGLSNVASDTTLSLPDDTPPAAVTDLAAINPTAHSITLTWTAPGNDGSTGTAAHYDIRYSSAPITAANWPLAHNLSGVPSPKPAGGTETFEVTGLGATIKYYFALKTADERPNWSPISNVADGTTLAVTSGWSAMGSGMGFEPYGASVLALTIYNGYLVAGGWFTSAGGVPVNMLAVWDGGAWSDLGSGRGNTNGLSAFAIYNGQLITGNTVDSNSQVPLWAWDGSSWTSLPGLFRNNVFALTTYGSLLVAGGIITGATGVPANSVAAWNGNSWSALGSGITPRSSTITVVYALGSYNNQLIAGGDFTNAGGILANGIAAWNGSSWSSLGSGVDGGSSPTVTALAVYDNKLIVGGYFTQAGGIACSYIASWDGSSWSTLAWGMSGGAYPNVSAFAVYNNRLIAGGSFTQAGGVPCNNIAVWDGTSWSPLGLGVDAQVRSLAIYNGQLIVGGDFSNAGGYPAASIASWTE